MVTYVHFTGKCKIVPIILNYCSLLLDTYNAQNIIYLGLDGGYTRLCPEYLYNPLKFLLVCVFSNATRSSLS